jgi:hypothetical protein
VHVYGAYIPAPTAQAVIITENAAVVRELIALKELIDVPPARVTSEFVQLTRADAEKVADLLNKLLQDKKDSAQPAGAEGPVGVPANVGTAAPLSNERDLLSGPAQIVADPRSNRILIVTRPVNMPFLKQMIAELDRPDTFMEPHRRELKYVLAQDILPALAGSLAQGKDEQDEAKATASNAPSNSSNSNPVQGASTSNSNNSTLQNGNGGQQSSSGGSEEQALTDPTQNNARRGYWPTTGPTRSSSSARPTLSLGSTTWSISSTASRCRSISPRSSASSPSARTWNSASIFSRNSNRPTVTGRRRV